MKFEEVYGRTHRGALSRCEAAETLGVSERTFGRWRDRYEAEGAYDRCLGRASAVGRGIPERDKPGCDADMGMMLGVEANILPRVWSILFSPSRPSVVPVPGTAFCHEIGGLEAPQPGQ